MSDTALRLEMPGNPRYQPPGLQPYFGYDALYRGPIRVQLATLTVLHQVGIISDGEIALLTPKVRERALAITSTQVKVVEVAETRHDILALKQLVQAVIPEPLNRWVHAFLTSYDVIGTGSVLHYLDAHRNVVMPSVAGVITDLIELVRKHADLVQIGRTHGQHALPITVGFWLATILDRVLTNAMKLDELANNLVGKISGPVGASNAVDALGIAARCGGDTFERRVLRELGLEPAPISTQILPPESVAYYLHAAVLLSAALGQLGLDCRQLARTEISEITQLDGSSSSAMAHKTINPITYENTQGMSILAMNAYGLVFDCLQSEHQRDLVGSSLMRSWPAVIVFLQQQLDSMQNKRDGQTFLQRLTVNADQCKTNLALKANVLAAEMVYIALLVAGYPGDAHKLVNKRLVPYATSMKCHILDALDEAAIEDPTVGDAFARIPADLRERLRHPEQLVGNSAERALATVARAESVVQAWLPR